MSPLTITTTHSLTDCLRLLDAASTSNTPAPYWGLGAVYGGRSPRLTTAADGSTTAAMLYLGTLAGNGRLFTRVRCDVELKPTPSGEGCTVQCNFPFILFQNILQYALWTFFLLLFGGLFFYSFFCPPAPAATGSFLLLTLAVLAVMVGNPYYTRFQKKIIVDFICKALETALPKEIK